MKTRVIPTTVFILAAAACGGSSPGAPNTPIDLTGMWRESTGGDITWQLVQTGSNVTGTARTSDTSFPGGSVTGQGTITGSVSADTFTFTDSETVSLPGCSFVVTGGLTISGSQMTGRYVETDTCNGAVVRMKNGNVTMSR